MLGYESIPWDRWTATAWPLVVQLAFDATVILASAGLACWVLRRASASLRHGIWTVAIVGLLALPVLRLALPGVPLGRLLPIADDLPGASLAQSKSTTVEAADDSVIDGARPGDAAYRGFDTESDQTAATAGHHAGQDASFAPLLNERPRREDAVLTGEAAAQAVPIATAAAESAPGAWHWFASLLPWPAVLVAVWAIGTAWGMLTLLRMLHGTRRLLGRATVVEDTRWDGLVTEVAGRLGVRGPIEVVESDWVAVPSMAGWLRPKIILPAEHRQWSAELRRVVLAHELTHVARRDVLWQMVARSAAAFYWFHPLIWLAGRRLRWEREVACDDAVLRMGEKPSSYAGHLLGFAAALTGRSQGLSAAVAMATRRPIERRIHSVLQPGLSRAPMSVRAGFVLVVTTSLVLILVGLIRPLAGPEPALGATTEVIVKQKHAEQDKDTKELATAGATLPTDNTASDKPIDISSPPVCKMELAEPFTVKLPNQAIVTLVGITEYGSPDRRWWKPDGTRLEVEPYPDPLGAFPPEKGQIAREVAVRIDNPQEAPIAMELLEVVKIDAKSHPSGHDSGLHRVAAVFDDSEPAASVRIEYSAGRWESQVTSSGGMSTVGGTEYGIALAPAGEKDGSTQITVTHDLKDEHLRVVAVDRDGTVHQSKVDSSGTAGPTIRQLNVAFPGLPLDRIEEFRVETRPKRWIQFCNVSLHPGKQTEVKVITSEGEVLKMDSDPSESNVSDLETAQEPVRRPDSPSPTAAPNSTADMGEKSLDELTDDQLVPIAPAMADGLTKAAALAYETGTLATADQIDSLQTARDLRLASARLGYDEKAGRAALRTFVEQTEEFRRRVQALHDSGARGGGDLLLAEFHHAVAVADLARAEEARADEMAARVEAVKLADELWTAAKGDYSAGVIELTTLIDVLRGRRDANLSLGMVASDDYARKTMKRAVEEYARELEELRKRVEALREHGANGGEDVNYYAVLAEQTGAIRINAGGVMPLARRAVELARKRLDATRTAYETGTATVFALYPCFDGFDAVQAWFEEVREKEGAEASNASTDEKTDTVEQRLRVWRRIKALSDQGAKGGEAVDRRYAECQYVLARLRQYEANRQQEAQTEVGRRPTANEPDEKAATTN